jgi:hypothetical protein
MDRVSSCNVYVVQLDTQCSFTTEFIHKILSSYNTVAAGSIEQYVYYHLPIRSYSLKEALVDGSMRSETLQSRYNFVNKLNRKITLCI